MVIFDFLIVYYPLIKPEMNFCVQPKPCLGIACLIKFKAVVLNISRIIFSFLLICATSLHAFGQTDTVQLSLPEAIEMGQTKSLDAVIADNNYWAGYWAYKQFQALKLPSLNLYAQPFTFNRFITKQFNPSDTSYQYFEERNLNTHLTLSVDQNISLTGGKLYIDSDLGRLSNFGNGEQDVQFSATAIRIGIQQPLWGFNEFKWDKKIQPLQFEIRQRELAQSHELIAIKTIEYFFDCASAKLNHQIAINNFKNAEELHKIGLKRFDLAAIAKSDLLMLEMELVNSKNNLKAALNRYERAIAEIRGFLDMKEGVYIEIILPEHIYDLQIMPVEVLEKAQQYNPSYLINRQRRLEAERLVEKAKIESRFNANLSASYGLNQRSDHFIGAYSDMLDQERFDLTLNVPLIDWGIKKSKHNLAQRERDAELFSIKQQERDLEQEIAMTVSEFNLQKGMVESAKQAADIAVEIHQIKMQQFLIGEADINDLIIQLDRKDTSLRKYLDEFQKY